MRLEIRENLRIVSVNPNFTGSYTKSVLQLLSKKAKWLDNRSTVFEHAYLELYILRWTYSSLKI